MSDLTERLRHIARDEIQTTFAQKVCASVINEGAEEIERLRSENAALKEANTRLRKACDAVDAHYSASLDYQPPYVRLAREALKQESK